MTTKAEEPRTRGHKKKQRTRQSLIQAAVEVIAARGEAFSVSDISAHAGVSNGTFYNYFQDRDELIAAVVPEVMASFARESDALVDEDDPARRFAVITARALRRAETSPDEVRVLLRLDAAQQVIADGVGLDHLRADLVAGATTGRFAIELDAATVDLIVGPLLFAARRIVTEGAAPGYSVRIVTQLLCTLGLDVDQALQIATEAVDHAPALDDIAD